MIDKAHEIDGNIPHFMQRHSQLVRGRYSPFASIIGRKKGLHLIH